jgi:arylsulfatase A-like enzyme
MGYFHFLPPHYPYKPHKDFTGAFTGDSFKPLIKPEDVFSEGKSEEFLDKQRAPYDEFILNVDHEFARLFEMLESSGILENTWLVFTSDHGELFERGIWTHSTAALYQPVVRVPLLIFEPGNSAGRDVYDATSAIDLMPTLLHLTGHEIPSWAEGSILPPYTTSPLLPTEGVFAVQARYNEPNLPITQVSAMHIQDNYKLVYYLGYEEFGAEKERFLLYDFKSDPEELNDLSQSKREVASDLINIVKQRLNESNKPYL